MTIQELGSIGELLGSIGVLLTLIYLAVQLKQNTRSLTESQRYAMAQTYQARTDSVIAVMKLRDPEVFAKLSGGRGPRHINFDLIDELTPVEKEKLVQFTTSFSSHNDNVQYQQSLGLINVELHEGNFSARLNYELCTRLNVGIRPNLRRVFEAEGFMQANADDR